MSFIEIKKIDKTYIGNKNSKDIHVLESVNFDIKEGEFFCILGPSGCGKSTLLNIMAGFERADAGEVMINGQKIIESNQERLIILQELGLFPWKSVKNNISFGLEMKGIDKKRLKKM